MNKQYNDVKEFHKAFNHPYSEDIKLLPRDRVLKRQEWMIEEIDEFKDSFTTSDQLDAMIDLIYFALGTLVEMGVKDVDKYFDIVHNCNMVKLFEDGKPRYNKDNKVIKPKGWVAPDKKIREELFKDILK